jgi:oligoribonuclease
MELRKITPQKLLWVDLEMTGLDPAQHKIVEVAAIVTDWDFKELGSYEAIIYQPPEVLQKASPVAKQMDQASGLWDKIPHGQPEAEVQEALASFIKQYFGGQPALLAGNSIHMDRLFIRAYWPKVEQLLHYRMLDVSAWKVVMIGKYSIGYEKKEAHRALDDIRESIAELKFYLQKAKF